MKLTEGSKILDDKIKANQAQYDLRRETAKIIALSSKNLDKYKYLTCKDFGNKPGPTEIKLPEYSPLAQINTKALKKDNKINKTSPLSLNLIHKTNFTKTS